MASSRRREGGQAVPHLSDFVGHINGTAHRHLADQIDISPALGLFNGTTVQAVLEQLNTYASSAGQGFVSLGDGYDLSNPADFVAGSPATPTLTDAFNAAFQHPRLTNGGVILVKAGSYGLDSTVSVPPGIVIMGELGGTIIQSTAVEQPMFLVRHGVDRPVIGPVDNVLSIDPLDKTVFFNIVLTDGYVGIGDPNMTTVPMVEVETGSFVEFSQVTFLGKMGAIGPGPDYGRTKTIYAVGTTSISSDQTTMIFEKCVFDGVRTMIRFGAGSSDDKLTVNNCKGRAFGTESNIDGSDPTLNCFILASGIIDAKITNNYLIGTDSTSTIKALVTHLSGNAKYIISGNSGQLFSSAQQNTIINDNGAGAGVTVIRAVISGNYWNNTNIQNQWFITVGDGTNSVGDFNGVRAIDTVLSTVANGLYATVYILYGTYSVLSNGGSQALYPFIGRKSPTGALPIVSLDSTSGISDPAGYKFISLGYHVENIAFTSTDSWHSVYCMRGVLKGNVTIKGCSFDNTALVFDPLGLSKTQINIEDCVWTGDNTFDNQLQLLAPPANVTNIKNCVFTGPHYAVAIGSFSGYVNNGSNLTREVNIEDSSFEFGTGSFFTTSPFTPTSDRYITISDSSTKVNITNVTIDGYTASINSGLTTFTRFIDISAKHVNLNNVFLNAPNAIFDVYALPGIFIEPRQSVMVDEVQINTAMLGMQISGALSFDDGITDSLSAFYGISIRNSQMLGRRDSISTTALDIDVTAGAAASISYLDANPIIHISGCQFENRGNPSINRPPVNHYVHIDPSYYDVTGCVQIYAPGFDIHVSDNTVTASAQLNQTYFISYAALHINAMDVTTGIADPNLSKVNVSNNNLYLHNFYVNGASPNDYSATASILARYFKFTNNYVTIYNPSVPVSNSVLAMYIYNPSSSVGTVAGSESSAIVTGNYFTRLSNSALSTITAYIEVNTASGRGTLANNEFNAPTVDGSGTFSLINFGTSWNVNYNKNLICRALVNYPSGMPSLSVSSGINIKKDLATDSISSYITAGANGPVFRYNDTTQLIYYNYEWQLNNLLPKDAKIYSVTLDYTASSTFSTTGELHLMVTSNAASPEDSTADLTSSSSGSMLTPISNPEDFNCSFYDVKLVVLLLAEGAVARTVEYSNIYIEYHW